MDKIFPLRNAPFLENLHCTTLIIESSFNSRGLFIGSWYLMIWHELFLLTNVEYVPTNNESLSNFGAHSEVVFEIE